MVEKLFGEIRDRLNKAGKSVYRLAVMAVIWYFNPFLHGEVFQPLFNNLA